MSRSICPRESDTLVTYRRGRIGPSIAAHVDSCTVCAQAIATERALSSFAAADDKNTRPFPSAAALRLEGELRREEDRLVRRARIQVGFHAAALAISLGLLAAVRATEVGPARTLGSIGSLCAIVVVAISTLNLVRTAQELVPRA